jgi:hypothetical protein
VIVVNCVGYLRDSRSEGYSWERVNDEIDFHNTSDSLKGVHSLTLVLKEDVPHPRIEKSDGSAELKDLVYFFTEQLEQAIVRFPLIVYI